MAGVAAAGAIFAATRYFAGPAPRTMNKEWQEQTNEYFKVGPIERISAQRYHAY